MIHNVFQNIEEEETLPNLFYKASVILLPTLHKDSTKKKTRQHPLMNQMQKSSTNVSKSNPATHKKNNQDQWTLFWKCKSGSVLKTQSI